MTICAVKWCHNSTGKQNKLDNITFHAFPVDPFVAALWAEKIRLSRHDATWKPTKSTRICCIHFDEKDLYSTKRGLIRIRRNAIPTKYLHIACNDEHRGGSLDGVRENVQLKNLTMPESKTILQTTTTISIERIEDVTSKNAKPVFCKEEKLDRSSDETSVNANFNKIFVKEEKPDTSSDETSENANFNKVFFKEEKPDTSDETSENANFNKHLQLVCKEEKSGNTSDEFSQNDNLNAIFCKEDKKEKTYQLQGFSSETIKLNTTMMALQSITSENAVLNAIVIKEDNQLSDEKRENASLNTPSSSFQELSGDEAKLNWPTTSVGEYSEDNNDLDSLYNTPREELLQNQLKKKTLLQIKHSRMIKTLNQKNRRLKKKNKALQLIIASLRKNKPTKGDTDCTIMAENTEDSEDEDN